MLAGLFFWMLVTSLVTAILYVWDKRSAARGRDRIAERTLLVWSLLGGWPGGWIAGRMVRHKTQKRSYRIKFGFCVLLNVGALIVLLEMMS